MDPSNKGLADPLASKADQKATKTKKVARDALVSVRMEKKVKIVSVENVRRKAARRATLQSYFSSSRGFGSGQLLSLVLDSRFLDVPGAKSDGVGDYLSIDSNGTKHTVSIDTNGTPSSSGGSSDTHIISSKSLLIALSDSLALEDF